MHGMPQRHNHVQHHRQSSVWCVHPAECVFSYGCKMLGGLITVPGGTTAYVCELTGTLTPLPHLFFAPPPTGFVSPGYLFNPISWEAELCPVDTYGPGFRAIRSAATCIPCGDAVSTRNATGQSSCGECCRLLNRLTTVITCIAVRKDTLTMSGRVQQNVQVMWRPATPTTGLPRWRAPALAAITRIGAPP